MASVFKDDILRGKVAYMTGGTSGIGLGVARRFAEHGASVYVVSRSLDKVEAAVAQLQELGASAAGMAVDVRTYADVERSAADCEEKLGKIDFVMAAAAGNFPAPALGMSDRAFKAVVDIDLVGTFNALRACFAHLNTPGASVVAITAPQAEIPIPLQAHACAAKAGILMMIKTLAMEWGPAGVRVNAVSPGPIADTEGMRRLASSPKLVEKALARQAISRLGTAEEIGDACVFLASDAARYITGASLSVDGGMVLGDAQPQMG